MNERIKKILEELGLKKVEFAERLHISRPYASELCSGAKAPSDRTISDICREFGVREAWLRVTTSAKNGFVPARVKCLYRTPSPSRWRPFWLT